MPVNSKETHLVVVDAACPSDAQQGSDEVSTDTPASTTCMYVAKRVFLITISVVPYHCRGHCMYVHQMHNRAVMRYSS